MADPWPPIGGYGESSGRLLGGVSFGPTRPARLFLAGALCLLPFEGWEAPSPASINSLRPALLCQRYSPDG